MKKRSTAVFGRKGASGRRVEGAADRERDPRKAVMAPAQLLYCSGAAAVNVTLRDVSKSGARIVSTLNLPAVDEFELAYGRERRRCSVVWRGQGALGVRFL